MTDKFFFHTLVNSQACQELFFDHYTQQSAGKHGPFLTKNLKEDDFIEISEKHIKKEVIQITDLFSRFMNWFSELGESSNG